MALLEVKSLSFKYEGEAKKALDEVSLSLGKGESLLLAGPSGCGKTTLLRAITGLIPKFYKGEYSGSVKVDGKEVLSMSQEELVRSIGYVFQNPENQLVSYIVERDVAFALENLGYPREEMRKRVNEILKELYIEDLKERPIRTLSDGQKQLVALAGVLVTEPKLIILDEPTSTLDPFHARAVIRVLIKLVKEKGLSAIIVEHRLEAFVELVDYLAVMKDGKVIAFGKPEEVLNYGSFEEIRIPAFIKLQREALGKVYTKSLNAFLKALEKAAEG